MGLIGTLMSLLFGGGRNAVKDTAEVFRENAEAGAGREAMMRQAALLQFASEFAHPKQSWFNRLMDGINRLPRPLMAFGTLGLFMSAMTHPIWFAERMQGIALVPEPLWWLLGAVVSFYFGARHQAKGQALQRELATTLGRTADVIRNLEALEKMSQRGGSVDGAPIAPAEDDTAQGEGDANAALMDWNKARSARS